MLRDIKKFNKDCFLDNINSLALKTDALISCNENYSIENAMNQFINEFSAIIDQHAPLRPQTRKELQLILKPWISKGILKSIQTKNSLFKKCYKKNDLDLIANYKKYCNKLTTIKRIAKQNYYASMIQINKKDLSKQWQLINQILHRNNKHKPTIEKLLTENNEFVTNDKEIGNELNSFFTSIGPKMVSKIPNTKPTTTISSSTKPFFCEPCTINEVFLKIMQLNEKKSTGILNIPIKFIKMSAEFLSSVLAKIFNTCMQIGIFPSLLKIAKITPIHKSGCTHTASNYRPISILSPFSKIFENIIYNRLNDYFMHNNFIAKEQFGFRIRHSTNQVIADVVNKLQISSDDRLYTYLILLDLSKAFDTVDHQILLIKLEKYGIRGNTLKLIHNYLINRKQTVNINNTFSDLKTIKCGVPQGSILGPLLFSIYVNDLPKASNFDTRLFADDTALLLTDSNLTTLNKKVNSEFSKIENWLNANKLSLNYSKTKYLLYTPKSKDSQLYDFTVKTKGIKLERCKTAKYLGVILDEKLNWEPQIKHLKQKLSQSLGIIAKMRHYLNQKNMISLYYAFFYSHILYGILGWGSATQVRKKSLQILQHRVLRVLNKSSWKDKITNKSLFLNSKLFEIDDIYKYELGKFMYLSNIKALPEIFENYFLSLEQKHNYNTRSKSKKNYFVDTVQTNFGKNSLKFKRIQLWNKLPSTIKSFSFFRFKKEYQKLLWERYKQNI